MATERRLKRLESIYFQEASRLFRFTIKDPRLKGAVISRAQLTKDLRQVILYVRLPDQDLQRTVKRGLDSVVGMVQSRVGQILNLRFVPLLQFRFDDHFEKMEDIERALHQIKLERESEDTPTPPVSP